MKKRGIDLSFEEKNESVWPFPPEGHSKMQWVGTSLGLPMSHILGQAYLCAGELVAEYPLLTKSC